jgi:hypothetical protein
MSLKKFFLFTVFIVLLPALTSLAQGVITYLDNTSDLIKTNSDLPSFVGAQFHTGTNAGGYRIDGLQLLFADAQGEPGDPRFRILLLEDYFNSAGPIISYFLPTDNPTNAGLHAVLPDRLTELQANTDYWLLWHRYGFTSAGSHIWSFTDSANSASIDGWRVTGEIFMPGQIGIPLFSVNATAIPEPSTLALTAAAFTILFSVTRVRRRLRN